jgi:hypothetical protein
MAVAIYMTHKDGIRNLYEAGIDQVFMIPAGSDSGDRLPARELSFWCGIYLAVDLPPLFFAGETINYCSRNEYSPRARLVREMVW